MTAEAPGAALIGFAAKYADTPDPRTARWRQVGVAAEGTSFRLEWNAREAQADVTRPVPLVAVVCLAGEAPTDVLSARVYKVEEAATMKASLSALRLEGAEREAARQAACRYPSRRN